MTLPGSHLHKWAVCVSLCLSVCVCHCGNNVTSCCLVSDGFLEHLNHFDFSLGFQCSPPSFLPSSSTVKRLSLEPSVCLLLHIFATDYRLSESTHHTHTHTQHTHQTSKYVTLSLLWCKWICLIFVALLKASPSTGTHFCNSLFLVDVKQSMYAVVRRYV